MRRAARASGRCLIVAPTGAGKTQIACGLIRRLGCRTLFLAHRRELIEQAASRLRSIGIVPGIILSGEPEHRERQVQVASVATLVRRAAPEAALIIIDESHHARAESYQRLLAQYPDARIIGLTATPWRLDGRGLGELFEGLIVAARPRELIDRGFLVPIQGYAYGSPDVCCAVRGGDYERRGLELVMSDPKIFGDIIERWERHAVGARTLVFCVGVAHAEEMANRFAIRGHAAEHIAGSHSISERAEILARFRSGETRILCSVGILTEGFDCPDAECAVLARPTLSLALYLQMVGRVLRPAPGKAFARIHDHAGCVGMHGLPDEDRDYSLATDKPKRDKSKVPPLRKCPTCYAISGSYAGPCRDCGAVPKVRSAEPREERGAEEIPLTEIERKPEDPRAYYQKMKRIAKWKNYKMGWAAYQYKNKYGTWPPREMR